MARFVFIQKWLFAGHPNCRGKNLLFYRTYMFVSVEVASCKKFRIKIKIKKKKQIYTYDLYDRSFLDGVRPPGNTRKLVCISVATQSLKKYITWNLKLNVFRPSITTAAWSAYLFVLLRNTVPLTHHGGAIAAIKNVQCKKQFLTASSKCIVYIH